LYITGSPTSAYCISTSNSCACEPTFGIFLPPEATTTISNNRYVCLRHTSSPVANQTTSTTLFVGAQAATFYVSTGSPFGGANCSLDVDGNGTVDAMTDGLLLLRAMLGLTGTAVTTNAVGGNTPSRPTWDLIRPYLNGNCGTSFLQ
jgi:hypothetical protein